MSTSCQVLDAIGNTPLVELRRVVPAGSARIIAKLESANPTGSMKDRVARAMVERAAADGRLPPGGTVVEYTAGTTGISLALMCAARGYKAHFVFSDAFSDEKRRTMRAYGAQLTDVVSDKKRITEQLIKGIIAMATEISRRPGHWYCDQLNNRDGEAGYHWARRCGNKPGDRWTPSYNAWGRPIRSTARHTRCAVTTPGYTSREWSRPNRRCSRGSRQARTRSRASGSGSSRRFGGERK